MCMQPLVIIRFWDIFTYNADLQLSIEMKEKVVHTIKMMIKT